MLDYIRDPAAIYRESFATIEREADLARFAADERSVAIRMIHACGMTDLADDIVIAQGAVRAGVDALGAGAAIVCDVEMVRRGIIRSRLPADTAVLCEVGGETARQQAKALGTTVSAGGIEALASRLAGGVVVIGNAPTALFHLLEMLARGAEPPALIIGCPVGFVGAVESKEALIAHAPRVPFVTVRGRRGGSAIAAAALNAIAGGIEA
ncbi:precorrin-8X methylmutase [Oricola sp.]|uniref:precorrin-8X methylmutase n=1 Tax=Oricola sp. TaxID=1979950 RepID=UPI0025E45706|nr:precorrin-8X methylmutase [Oricola sp.]MCI5076256.1 precorrin-8X methylmutase [Oricola sp.]